MENLIFSLNATVPVFFMIFLGVILRKTGILAGDIPGKMNKLIFNVLIPVLLFRDISATDIGDAFSPGLFLFCLGATLVMFFVVWLYAMFFVPDESRGSFVVCSCRGSAAVLGIAFAENLYHNSGMMPVMILAIVPLYNILSVVFYSLYRGGKIPPAREIIVNVVKNPLIIGTILGVPFSIAGFDFPPLINKCIGSLATLATPLALLMVGAGFNICVAMKKIKLISLASAFKLVIFPLIFLPVAAALGFYGQEMIAILVMAGSPTTVAAYIMAQGMGNDEDLASGVVVITTVLSAVTITLAVSILHAFGLL